MMSIVQSPLSETRQLAQYVLMIDKMAVLKL